MPLIDVHHHFYTEAFTEALIRAGGDPSGWPIPSWTLEADQNFTRDLGIQTAILSATAPGASIEEDPIAAAKLARSMNDEAAAIRDAYPESYGFFASLPSLLDTEASIEEIAYSLDTLNADGVILFSRYGSDNHYLGYKDFRPIWEELQRREAVVFVHPTHAVDTNLVNPNLPQPMFDYPHETGRTALDMIVSGTLASVPDCKIILSHAGGTLPYLVYRPAGMLPHTPFNPRNMTTSQIVEEARKYYYDVAISSNPLTLGLLTEFAKPDHILFGSDYPNAPLEGIKYFTGNFEDYPFGEEERRKVEFGNALALFPRLRNPC